jgi:hypothetical protein
MSNNEEPTIADSIFKIVVGFLLLFIFYYCTNIISPMMAVVLFFPCFCGGIYLIYHGVVKFLN